MFSFAGGSLTGFIHLVRAFAETCIRFAARERNSTSSKRFPRWRNYKPGPDPTLGERLFPAGAVDTCQLGVL